MTIRVAMWSGPRNISTAMMRSWENRADCSVLDEPFYAYYLAQTKQPHPMLNEILGSQSNIYAELADYLSKGDCATPIQYQKHMTHHMLYDCDLQWTKALRHCMLIRDPAYVVNSYTNSRGVCSAEDIGIKRQFELYEAISDLTSQHIPIIDSAAVLSKPEKMIPAMCQALNIECGVETAKAMLNWPTGKRSSDGAWAPHWYHSVEQSSGFGQAKKVDLCLNKEQLAVVEEVMPYYSKMKARALTV